MKSHDSARAWTIAFLLGLAALVSFPIAAPADAPAPDRGTARYEIRFMKGMFDHHQMAIEMADMCLERALHEELRTLCGNIVSAQSAEIEEMQSWLDDWYGVSYGPRSTDEQQAQMEELASLSGGDFEIAFMEMMIEHHETAVKRGSRCTESAYHEELVSMCREMVETQTAEIEQMREWLCDWYGPCDG